MGMGSWWSMLGSWYIYAEMCDWDRPSFWEIGDLLLSFLLIGLLSFLFIGVVPWNWLLCIDLEVRGDISSIYLLEIDPLSISEKSSYIGDSCYWGATPVNLVWKLAFFLKASEMPAGTFDCPKTSLLNFWAIFWFIFEISSYCFCLSYSSKIYSYLCFRCSAIYYSMRTDDSDFLLVPVIMPDFLLFV